MAGGVALNCVANGRLLREGPVSSDCFVQRLVQVSTAFQLGAVDDGNTSQWIGHLKRSFLSPGNRRAMTPTHQEMAESITRFWAPGPATAALRPALVELIKLAQQFATYGALEEEVPESIYVMF